MPIKEEALQKFFYYIKERERIRQRKERGEPRPWTEDHILNTFKFTNVHRIDDRTTKVFKNIYDKYAPHSTPGITLLNCATFRYFGSAAFALALGWLKGFNREQIKGAVAAVRASGQKPFTGAYVITNGGQTGPKEEYVADILSVLSLNVDRIAKAMQTKKSWAEGARLLRDVPGFGGTGFMGKETLQDFMLTVHGRFFTDAETWTPVGPGARRGVIRILEDHSGVITNYEAYWLGVCLEIQRRAPEFTDVKMTAHDVQFCLCEFDKYCRAGEGGKLKNRYRETK